MVMSLKYAEAVETCAIALKLDPQNASIWFLKSFAHSMLGQYEEAVDSSTEGLKLEPGNNMVWSARGQYLYALGRLEEALESFGTALKMAPDNPYFQEVTGKIKKWLQRDGQSPEWASQVMDFLQHGATRML
jgi:tetratricopeptide (TPR) repeat protein